MKQVSPKSGIAAVILLAAVLPGLVWLAAHWIFGNVPHTAEPLHEGMEIAGAAIALSVAMFILLRLRHKGTSPHLLWVVTALIVMGLIDGVHGMSHFGPAWSWLRHSGTMFGGLFFALVWIPLPGVSLRRTRAFAVAAAGFALVLSAVIWLRPDWFPAPWIAGDYGPAVKAANALGGLGFMAAAVFFLRRYARQRLDEDLVFAGQTTLFGIASLIFGFSSVWAADWWVWHVARLAAYGIVLGAAYRFVSDLYDENSRHGEELEALVQARTAELRASEALSRNANVILKESRRAALNLMDDALATRRQAEQATAELRLEVAERMKAEEALRKSTAELQQLTGTLELRVRERTEALEASNARLRAEIAERLRLVAAVEQTGVGIAIMDAEGRITYVNPLSRRPAGRPAGGSWGRATSSFWPEKRGTGHRSRRSGCSRNAARRGATARAGRMPKGGIASSMSPFRRSAIPPVRSPTIWPSSAT